MSSPVPNAPPASPASSDVTHPLILTQSAPAGQTSLPGHLPATTSPADSMSSLPVAPSRSAPPASPDMKTADAPLKMAPPTAKAEVTAKDDTVLPHVSSAPADSAAHKDTANSPPVSPVAVPTSGTQAPAPTPMPIPPVAGVSATSVPPHAVPAGPLAPLPAFLPAPGIEERPKTPTLHVPGTEAAAKAHESPSGTFQRPVGVERVDTAIDLAPRTKSRRNSLSDAHSSKAQPPTGLVMPQRPAAVHAASAGDLKSGLASPIIPKAAVE